MNFISVIKKSENVRILSKSYKDDKRGYVDFPLVKGENLIPEDLFNILSETDFFKALVKSKELTVDSEKLDSESDLIDGDVMEMQAKAVLGLPTARAKQSIKNIENAAVLLRIVDNSTSNAVIKAAEKRIEELEVLA
jgi:hypothetical protein